MTYRELGKARGISAASAARLAYRKGWQRQPGNDGAARVAVPIGEDQPSPYDARGGIGDAATGEAPRHGARGAVTRGARDAHAAEFALAIEALRGELTASHQREAEASARADRAEAAAAALREQIETERQRADRTEQGREGDRARADELRQRLDDVTAKLADAQEQTEAASGRAEALQARIDGLLELWKAAEATAEEARQQAHQAAETAADVLRANDARRRQGLVARLRAAWRGE